MADQFQIISGKEAQEFKDMGVVVEWESAADRKTTLFRIIPATLEKKSIPREIIVHITGDVEIHPGIDTLDGSLELRQWASLLIWCTRLAYDKVYYIFNVDQLRFK